MDSPGPSKPPALCAICKTHPSKYTCPRCSTTSCSLDCSRTHKAQTSCTGERDRTAFVPMNQYSYSTLVNDYSFLEDVGRRVDGWGREIVRDGIDRRDVSASLRGTSMRGDRGQGRGRARKRTLGHGQERRRFLATQLALRDVDMDISPSGMERAQRNRSSWDSKAKKAVLTVEFIFMPPPDPYTRHPSKVEQFMAHKLDWNVSVRDMLRSSIKNSGLKRNDHLLQWLSLDEDDSDGQASVLCLIKRPKDPSEAYKQLSFHKLDWNLPLSKLLRNKQIMEYPTIHLIDESVFEGTLVDDDGTMKDVYKVVKRRRLDGASGKKAIATLVGGYGSDEDGSDEDEATTAALDNLADYAGSDNASEVWEGDDEDAEGVTDDEYFAEMGHPEAIHEDDGAGDWGDEEIAEDEAKIASLSAALQQRNTI